MKKLVAIAALAAMAFATFVATASANEVQRSSKLQIESMSLTGSTTVINGSDDEGSTVRFNNETALAAKLHTVTGTYNRIKFRAKGTNGGGACNWPVGTITIDGVAVYSDFVNSATMSTFISTFAPRNGGTFSFRVFFTNGDLGCNDLYGDWTQVFYYS